MNSIPLEDNFEDVLGKAMRGQGISPSALSEVTDVSVAEIEEVLGGSSNEAVVRRVATSLGLSEDCLCALANGAVGPRIELPVHVCRHNTPYPIPGYKEMTVNNYSIHPPCADLSHSFIVDTGAIALPAIEAFESRGRSLGGLILTHTHRDHVADYDRLSRLTNRVYSPEKEPYACANLVRDGDRIEIGDWDLIALEIPGHSAGGMCYLLESSSPSVCFVGDAIFCRSIGNASSDYEGALDAIRSKLLSLPNETILCPGHGPMTTVGFEKENNPFFAGR